MSTGIDIPNDVIGLLAETVERGASLLAGGSRLAGPAAAQDQAAELAPDESAGTVGLGLSFADDTAVVVVLTNPLAEELCGGSSPDHVRSGLQVLIDEITAGLGVPLTDSIGLADTPELVEFLTGRSVILGAGIFDGDAVVATLGAAGPRAGVAPAAPEPVTEPASESSDSSATAPSAAPAAAAPTAPHRPTSGAAAGPAVSQDVLARGLALLADVSLEVTAELGRSHLRVSELLALEPGSVIGLERAAGSPVDLLVNGSLFARAEVIVEEGRYAVRITELVGNGITA
ncbi:MAG TPA: FliM/FliN family flagellar motor switch protein [Microthrixaceae bacterium]|nr:FliM/FliN family flagellar motor switch protein [Microthrixaceae bacterium]